MQDTAQGATAAPEAAPAEESLFDEATIALLMASGAEIGFIHPIVREERTGQIIDGHQRLEVIRRCAESGGTVPDYYFRDISTDDPEKVAKALNEFRRQGSLPAQQRLTHVQMLRGIKIPGGRGPGGIPSTRQIAAALGCDHKTVQHDLAKSDTGENSPPSDLPETPSWHGWTVKQLIKVAQSNGIKAAGGKPTSKAAKPALIAALEALAEALQIPATPPAVTTASRTAGSFSSSGRGRSTRAATPAPEPVQAPAAEPEPEPTPEPEPEPTPQPAQLLLVPDHIKKVWDEEMRRLSLIVKLSAAIAELQEGIIKLNKTRPGDDKRINHAVAPSDHQLFVLWLEENQPNAIQDLIKGCGLKADTLDAMANGIQKSAKDISGNVHRLLQMHGYLPAIPGQDSARQRLKTYAESSNQNTEQAQ